MRECILTEYTGHSASSTTKLRAKVPKLPSSEDMEELRFPPKQKKKAKKDADPL